MKRKIIKLGIAIVAVALVQAVLLFIHRHLPGNERFREYARKENVNMNALFYSEEGHTSHAARNLRSKVEACKAGE